MGLWLLLLGLWVFEYLVFIPPGGASLVCRRSGASLRLREGLTLGLPWPGRLAAVLDGIPFEVTRDAVSARGALSLFSATAGMEEERTQPLGSGGVEASGPRVDTATGPLLRASTDVAAGRIARWLAAIDGAPAAERHERFLALWREALSPTGVRDELDHTRRLTLAHRIFAVGSLAAVAAGIPAIALGAGLGFGGAWEVAWPFALGLHALGWLALLFAEGKLAAPGRALRLFRALVFPPTLWRASVELASAKLGDRHPLALALALHPRDTLLPLGRRALAECAWAPFDRGGRTPPPDAEERREALRERRALLLEAFEQAGLSEAELVAPPTRRDANAESYCPICQSEFVVGAWVCPDCRVEARSF
ncbi:MAG: hypothetical protein ABFS41_00020 [Myxococcota bacterium]